MIHYKYHILCHSQQCYNSELEQITILSTMNTATIITLIALGIMLVDACPIVTSLNGSCCEVKSNKFKFSTSPLKSRIYNITNFCGDCEVLCCY